MKKRFLLLIALVLCVSLPLTALAEFAFVQLGTDLLAQADPSSQIVSFYGAGAWVEINDDDSADEGFVCVTGPDGLVGYVADTDVFILSQTPQNQIAVVTNNGKYVNLRAAASKQAQVLAQVNSGTPMLLLNAGKTFDHVSVGGLEGYMVTGMVKTGLRPISNPVVQSANGKNVNLRSEPTMNGDILASVPYGSQVSVYMLGGGWAYVQYRNVDGYMMSRFLTSSYNPVPKPVPNPVPNPVPDPGPMPGPVPNPDPDSDFWTTGQTCYVNNGGASVRYRSGPGGSASVLGKLASGTEVFEISTNGAWSKITIGYGGEPVYMMSQYLVTFMPIDDDPVDIGDDPVIDDDYMSSGD